jgi:aspartyl-tRNA(Asn)/glutamyl-tRNA(Gln) amidotransferase subunit A
LDLSDLSAAARAVAQGRASAERLLDEALAAARGPAARHAFLQLREADARAAAQRADAAVATGADPGALAGLAVSIKDLFDIAGDVTAAGSLALADTAPAAADAPVVARLRAAGAALIGRTNMTEFAFSGIGLNPHFDTPANVTMAALDSEPRIPGGSSSGAAVSVACGAAWAALGSDTGGSIRIPAAFHGLVGFKNTQALTPSAGSVPLAPSLDTACAITRSVRDAVRVHEVLAQRRVPLARRPLASLKLAVIATPFLDALEPPVAAAFEQALRTLSAQGASVCSPAVPALA